MSHEKDPPSLGPTRRPSARFMAAGGSVETLDELQAQVAEAVREVMRERITLGYLDASESEVETIARRIGIRARPAVADALFEERQRSVLSVTPPEALDADTRKTSR